ncbi:MAG TPA: hypothetical protein VHB21_05005, partial [Minicystis sp.]|nr:hypothetical protein [Minicystis sp.]
SLGPKVMDYDEGEPIPAGYHLATRARKGLVITGGVLFGTFWLFSALGAAIANDTGDRNAWPFYVPAVGPFIALATEGQTRQLESSLTFAYVLDGLIQTGGLAMFVGGLAFPSTKLVRNDIGATKPRGLFADVTIRPAPVSLGDGRLGLGFVGTL